MNAFELGILEKTSYFTMDDIAGHEGIKNIFRGMLRNEEIDEEFEISGSNAFLICGPEGSGRSTFVDSVVGTYVENGYKSYELFITKNGSFPDQIMAFLSNELSVSNVIVVIRNIELLKDSNTVFNILDEFSVGKHSLLMLGIVSDERKFDLNVGMFFQSIYLQFPDAEERKDYFKRNLSDRGYGDAVQIFTDSTEGFGYGQMETLIRVFTLKLKNARALGVLSDDYKDNLEKFAKQALADYKIPGRSVAVYDVPKNDSLVRISSSPEIKKYASFEDKKMADKDNDMKTRFSDLPKRL